MKPQGPRGTGFRWRNGHRGGKPARGHGPCCARKVLRVPLSQELLGRNSASCRAAWVGPSVLRTQRGCTSGPGSPKAGGAGAQSSGPVPGVDQGHDTLVCSGRQAPGRKLPARDLGSELLSNFDPGSALWPCTQGEWRSRP